MSSLPNDSEIQSLRDQFADARSHALQFQCELETACAALERPRQELWKAHHRLTTKECRSDAKRSGSDVRSMTGKHGVRISQAPAGHGVRGVPDMASDE